MSKVSFVLLVHAHQPVGNFDHVIEEAYQKSYAPFVRVLENHPQIRVSLHYSGILLEWFERQHPKYIKQLARLTTRGQVEMVGGGYYEPILPMIPDRDKLAQIRKMALFLRNHFGETPRGGWVAERVWEPSLARPLAEAGVEYVLLDDTHFLAAGLDPSELHTTYITEEAGFSLRLVPSLKILRYTIPFQDPDATIGVLREGIGKAEALFAMGDDCEKFGVWPGTYDHCYTHGWLERFLGAVQDNAEWLETTTVSDYLAAHPPRGRVYLPNASYPEMMEWALPASAAGEFKACLDESEHLQNGERFRRFLRGGMWRTFLAKYPESNQVQKFMLSLSERLEAARLANPQGREAVRLLSEAEDHLLAGQCNDPYWHGIFGGLYAPHLRSAVIRHLIQAEILLDRLEGAKKGPAIRVETEDFDVDGQDEVLIRHSTFGMVLRPADGGTVSSLRFKPASADLVNSLTRRPEAYHELVRQKVMTHDAPKEGPASIHDRVVTKEKNLGELLRYDHYLRHAFRTYVFPAAKTWQDFDYLHLEENRELAGGPWFLAAAKARSGTFELRREAMWNCNGKDLPLRATKTLKTQAAGKTWKLECQTSLAADQTCPAPLALGVELIFNLLAPDAPDRYFLANDIRRPLEFKGEIEGTSLLVVDEWQRVRIALEARPKPRWWIVPVETISQSESGFERVYQGSAILAVWKIDAPAWRDMQCVVRAEITQVGTGDGTTT
ncbi:MAG TPA: alpha-amylase/4-alpha-glucanotransferase domain-containing protein [Terriglobia bacterium]|nr:alpha-amylase/4-alpha-glucanotransferase domain-containing protein [Terriglobia bacterium]